MGYFMVGLRIIHTIFIHIYVFLKFHSPTDYLSMQMAHPIKSFLLFIRVHISALYIRQPLFTSSVENPG